MAKIGLQLYTIQDEARSDILGALRAVARMGYDGVEFPWIPDEPAEEVRKVLTELNLLAAGVVVPRHQMEDRAAFEAAIAYNHAIGSPTIVLPWLDEPFRNSAESFKESAAFLNRSARVCRDNGLNFLYHIHGYEFDEYGGKSGLEILTDETDAALVFLELDTYWVEHGGADALATYLLHAARCPSIHFKDMNNRREMHDVEVGEGIIDTRGIVRAALARPVDWFIVEQEKFTMPPLESAAISLRNLRRIVAASQ